MDVSPLLELAIVGLARAALATVPVFAIVLATTTLARRWLAPWARQALWSLVLLRLLLPISIGSPASLQIGAIRLWDSACSLMQPQRNPPATNLAYVDADEQEWEAAQPMPTSLDEATQADRTQWLEFALVIALPCLLFGGMIAIAVWTAVTTWRLRRWVRAGSECDHQDWLALLAEGQRRFQVDGQVALRIVPSLLGPATCGWWRPTILLPADSETWSNVQMRHVLWHELAHIRRHDVAANWLLALIRVLHWWNPIFWWAQRAWLAERELACDALVLQRLEEPDAREYGQTLLHFLERLANHRSAGISNAAPGFVLFWGRKREARRRLTELATLCRPEPKWRRWAAVGLVAVLAVAGLTDAAVPPPVPPPAGPLELPTGITWSVVPPSEPDDSAPRSVRVYDIAQTIAYSRREDPELSGEMAGLSVQLILQGVLQPSTPGLAMPSDQAASSTCAVQEQNLVVNATAAQHEEVHRLLTLWNQSGLRQVSVEERLVTTELSLKDLLTGAGGTVLNADAIGQKPLSSERQNVPAFVRVLDHQEMAALMTKVQADPRSNVMFAPKVTVFDGMSASVQTGVQRPFVTGLQTAKDGVEPQISVVSEGVRIQIRPHLATDGKSTELDLQYQASRIESVEVLETTSAGESSNVQIPHVSRSVVATTAKLPQDHTLLVAPLRRDGEGRLHLCLITPRPLP